MGSWRYEKCPLEDTSFHNVSVGHNFLSGRSLVKYTTCYQIILSSWTCPFGTKNEGTIPGPAMIVTNIPSYSQTNQLKSAEQTPIYRPETRWREEKKSCWEDTWPFPPHYIGAGRKGQRSYPVEVEAGVGALAAPRVCRTGPRSSSFVFCRCKHVVSYFIQAY